MVGADAGAGVVSVVQGALGKEAEKESIMEAPSPHLGDHKLISWPYSDPSTGLTLHVCIPQPSLPLIWHKILTLSVIQKEEDFVINLNLAFH